MTQIIKQLGKSKSFAAEVNISGLMEGYTAVYLLFLATMMDSWVSSDLTYYVTNIPEYLKQDV